MLEAVSGQELARLEQTQQTPPGQGAREDAISEGFIRNLEPHTPPENLEHWYSHREPVTPCEYLRELLALPRPVQHFTIGQPPFSGDELAFELMAYASAVAWRGDAHAAWIVSLMQTLAQHAVGPSWPPDLLSELAAVGWRSVAELHIARGHLTLAEWALERASPETARWVLSPRLQAETRLTSALLCFRRGAYADALLDLADAEKIQRRICRQGWYYAACRIRIAQVHSARGHRSLAVEAADQALTLLTRGVVLPWTEGTGAPAANALFQQAYRLAASPAVTAEEIN